MIFVFLKSVCLHSDPTARNSAAYIPRLSPVTNRRVAQSRRAWTGRYWVGNCRALSSDLIHPIAWIEGATFGSIPSPIHPREIDYHLSCPLFVERHVGGERIRELIFNPIWNFSYMKTVQINPLYFQVFRGFSVYLKGSCFTIDAVKHSRDECTA